MDRSWNCLLGVFLAAALVVSAPGLSFAAEAVPSATWPMYQYDSSHNAVFDNPAWRLKWKAPIGGRSNGGISIVGQSIYIESFDHNVYALNALTGKERWRATLPAVAMNTPVVVSGMVIAGTGTGETVVNAAETTMVAGHPGGDGVYGLSVADGRVLWRFGTLGEDMPTGVYAILANRPAYIFSNGDQHVYAIDPSTGHSLWTRTLLGGNFMSSLTLYDGVIYGSGSYAWDYYYRAWLAHDESAMNAVNHSWALDVNSSQFLWTSLFGQGTNSPAAANGIVFLQTIGEGLPSPKTSPAPTGEQMLSVQFNEVEAVAAQTGALLWKWRSGAGGQSRIGSNIETAGGLYVSGVLYQALPLPAEYAAFAARSGKLLWKIRTQAPVKMPAVEKGGWLYFGDTAGDLYVVRADTGVVRQKIKFPGIFTASPPVIVGETLFISGAEQLYALPLDEVQRGMLTI